MAMGEAESVFDAMDLREKAESEPMDFLCGADRYPWKLCSQFRE